MGVERDDCGSALLVHSISIRLHFHSIFYINEFGTIYILLILLEQLPLCSDWNVQPIPILSGRSASSMGKRMDARSVIFVIP